MKSVRRVGLTLVCAAALASPVFGQSGWVGREFMPKDGCVMKVGNREFRRFGVPIVVRQVSGEWLWVGRGWVQKSRVVPLEQAAAYYTEYLRNHPTSTWAYRGRGIVWDEKGDYSNALKDYTEAIRLDPAYALAYYNRGIVWGNKGGYDNALKDYTEAIRLDPAYALAYNNIGWLLATCPVASRRDGKRAVTTARKACELSGWKDANNIGTLGAACAESGDFDEAIRWETKAMEMLSTDAAYVKGARERLALYREGKPYREPPAR